MNYTKFMEALKGKQHKIDKNKNGKIDSHDFKLLRKEEQEITEADTKTSKYSWGTMKTVHHGADFSIPLHPEHHQAIAKLEHGEEHKFKTEDGKQWTAKRIGSDVHFNNKYGQKTQVPHDHLKEEKTTGATKVVHTRTGADGAKYHIMQDSPSDYSIHREHNGKTKHIDTYGSLNRAKSVLDNEVKEEVEHIDEIDMSKTLTAYNKDKPHYAQAKIDTRTSAERRAETDKKLAAQKKPVVQPTQPVKSKPVTADDINKQIAKSYADHKPGQYVGDSYELNGEVMSEESLDEKLNPSMGAGEYIKDFQKSDAPQFAGKSKEKRRVMGIAAYLSAKSKMKEEVELEENAPVAPVLDKKYIKGTPENKAYKATKKPINGHPTNVKEEAELEESSAHKKIATFFKNREIAQRAFKALTGGSDEDQLKALQKRTGVPVTGKKPVKEEIEELDEKSEQARKNKIMKNVMDASKGAKYNRDSGLKLTPGDTGHSTAQQMNKAIGRNLRREDIEEAAPVSVKVNHALEAPHEEQWEDTGICPEHNKKDCHECGKAAMKEDTGQKSYKEFMMMLEYESDKSGSYKHTGTYGSEYAKKEREKDEEGFDSEPAKRGPKTGSKRGPKANLGSSKLHTK